MLDQRSAPRVAIVGAGISGLSCGRVLAGRGLNVVVFEKSRGPGGRMSTRRIPDSGHSFDHGAQFFTASTPPFQEQVERWRAAGVIQPWEGRFGVLDSSGFREKIPDSPRYVGVPRMSALTRHLAGPLYLKSGTRIVRTSRTPQGWNLLSTNETTYGPFAAVICAVPGPQAAPLLAASPELASQARSARLVPCHCVMAAFDEPLPVRFDAARVTGSPLQWIARNTSKPGRGAQECWVLHASGAWSRENLHAEQGSIRHTMLETFADLTATLEEPEWSIFHRWRYALAEGPFDPEQPCLWDPERGLGACGDWLTGGRVELAWVSGQQMARSVLSWVQSGGG